MKTFKQIAAMATRGGYLHWILTGALGIAAMRMAMLLATRIAFELTGPLTVDSPIYLAVGRGILNGLIPYRDLFESKPPGIFLLSAFSFWTTGSPVLMSILQAVVIAMTAGTLCWYALRHIDCGKRMDFLLLLISLVLGTALALYSGARSGSFQVESFGAAFGSLYLLSLVTLKRPSIWRTLLRSTLLLISVGMKEPFFLSIAAGSMLLIPSMRQWMRDFLLPLCIAAGAGIIALLMLGYLGPYVSIYLHHMLTSHITQEGSPLMRGLNISIVFRDLAGFSPLLAATLLGAYGVPLVTAFLAPEGTLRFMRRSILVCAALYLTSLAVGMGGEYYDHHFIFALPAHMAAALLLLREIAAHSHRWHMHAFAYATAALLLVSSFAQPSEHFMGSILGNQNNRAQMETSAAYIDSVLDACGLDRYLFVGPVGNEPYAFTRHSPLGPVFFLNKKITGSSDKNLAWALLNELPQADFAVSNATGDQNLKEQITPYLNMHFSKIPWSCAKNLTPSGPYTYLFRTDLDAAKRARVMR